MSGNQTAACGTGISVSVVCKTIVEVVKYKLESMTGVKVRKVNISVEGIRVQ